MNTDVNTESAFEAYKYQKSVNGSPGNKKEKKKLKILLKPTKGNKTKSKSKKKEGINALIKEEIKNTKKNSKILHVKKVKKTKKVSVAPSIQEVGDHNESIKKESKKKRARGEKKNTVFNLDHMQNGLDETNVSLEKKTKLKKKSAIKNLKTHDVSNKHLTKPRTKKVMQPKTNLKKILFVKSKDCLNSVETEKKYSVASNSANQHMDLSVKNESFTEDSDIKLNIFNTIDSASKGRDFFAWMIYPVAVDQFFSNSWECRPAHVTRNCKDYFKSFLSVERIDQLLRNHELHYGRNIDITSYTNGVRETHNLDGRAYPGVVWDYYSNGCSVRLLNPQSYVRKLHSFNASLQEFFGCFVGANAYLTPPNSQGFAPHYDDIEAFVLQIEGEKLWKLYPPRSQSEVLPRFSSGNFKEEDLPNCIMEITLKPGDMLYFPRGIIHQGRTLSDKHSLHITLSVYQKNSWADLLEKLIPATLKVAVEENSEFREGLPLNYFSCMGVVHSESNSPERTQFLEKLQTLLTKLFQYAPIDAAVDQLCKQFQHDALPPVLFPEEKMCSVFGGGPKMLENGKVVNHVELDLDTKVRLLRRNILRLVLEDNIVRIYHSVHNSKVYHELEEQFLEIDEHTAPAVEMLIHSYPVFISIDKLPLANVELKMQLATDLWEAGLIITENPLSDYE